MKSWFVPALLLIAYVSCLIQPAFAQPRCTVSVQMVNHNRYAYETAEECSRLFHSVPWGNWGVSSNIGSKQDTDQFKGWRQPCSQLKVEWNSCSENSRYRSPNYLNFPNQVVTYPYPANGYPFSDPYLWNDTVPPFGSAYKVDQYSPCGPNVYGGFQASITVALPVDYDNDGVFDAGGCADLDGYALNVQQNFMSVYELDAPDSDDLIESLYFPDVSVNLSCTPDACFAVGDNDYDGWINDIYNQSSAGYMWPILYQDNNGVTCRPNDASVPCKRIDASVRIGRVTSYYAEP